MSQGRQGQGVGGWVLGQQGDSPISASPPLQEPTPLSQRHSPSFTAAEDTGPLSRTLAFLSDGDDTENRD